MADMEWTLEIILIVLLAATLIQALRLERALNVLKRDRASLESVIAGFNVSTHQAESGIQQLRAAVDGAGRAVEGQLHKGVSLKDDLEYLMDRGNQIADRLEQLVSQSRPLARERQPEGSAARDILQALRSAR